MGVTRCCCCWPLRAGCMAIAITYLTVNCLVLLGWTSFLIERAVIARRFDYYMDLLYIYLGLMLVGGPSVIVNSLLVHGLRRNRRRFVTPWVVWYGFLQTLITLALLAAGGWALYVSFGTSAIDASQAALINAVIWIPGLAGLGILWYWYACVFSHFQVLAPSDEYAMGDL